MAPEFGRGMLTCATGLDAIAARDAALWDGAMKAVRKAA
jgi:hypothetical protein